MNKTKRLVSDMSGRQKNEPLKETLEDMFDIGIERRLRTAIFVQALYPKLTMVEALEKLRDPIFLRKMIGVLNKYVEESPDDPEESLVKIRTLFAVKHGEEEEE